MADSFVQVAPDSTGKMIDAQSLTNASAQTVCRQTVTLGDPSAIGSVQTVRAGGSPPNAATDGAAVVTLRDAATVVDGGSKITAATMPAGGVGLTGWLSAIWALLGGALSVVTTASNPATIASGQQTTTTSAAALPSQALTNGVVVKALSTNTGTVYVGPSGVTASSGYPLKAGEAISYAVTNLSAVEILGTNTSDAVAFTGN